LTKTRSPPSPGATACNDLNLDRYLRDVLILIADYPINRIGELLPGT
jgi:hypothetical protein